MICNWLPIRALAGLLLLVTISSCGGGGGGADGSSGSLFFTADKASVSFDYSQDQFPPSQLINISATGDYKGNLYIGAKASGPGIAATIPISISGMSASAQISVATGLAPGTYTGQIQLLACSDTACAHQIGNSPLTVAFTITVRDILKLTPAVVDVDAVSGTPTTQLITVHFPTGADTFLTEITSGTPWLTVTATTDSSFTISMASMPSGSYRGDIKVSAGAGSVDLPIVYSIAAAAGGEHVLSANPSSLTLATVENATTSATLGITPPSWDPDVTATVEYPVSPTSGWLTLTPTAGGQQVVANAATLTAGSYTASIRLHGAYPGTDVVVPVAFTVGAGLVRPADQPLTANAETTAAMLSGSVPVNVVTGPAIGWTASSNVPWLLLTKSSGQTGETLAYAVDTTVFGTLPNAAMSSAAVTITPSLTSMTPVTFNVNINKNLPRITSLGPYVQLTNQATRVILRGSGFSSVGSLMTRLSMQGATMSSATLVNDTEVLIQTSALSAGSHTVSVSNALGLPTATGNVVAVDPAVYGYAAVPTGGLLASLAYDPERDSVYAANTTAESIMSFQHSAGATWTPTSVLFAKAYNVGLTQDGSTLLATANGGAAGLTIQRLNPTTLATEQVAVLNYTPEGILGSPIPTTNDGRSWLGLATNPPFSNLGFLPPGSLTPTLVTDIHAQTEFYGGPWFAMSRDGERLIITQTASISGLPMLYMNAADSVIRANPAGLTFSYQFSLSETGDRALFDNFELRDGQFNLIGDARIPTSAGQPVYYARNAQITPDGSRIYVLTYLDGATSEASVTPRVYVFDATTPQANLPVLGYFEFPDYPGCIPDANNTCTNSAVAGAISLDGSTLFFAGNERLIVEPVPGTLTPVSVAPTSPVLHAQQRPTMTFWPMNVH